MIREWWIAAGSPAPTMDMMPENSSFVLEVDGKPLLAVTVYMTNSKQIAWVDNLISSPLPFKGNRRDYVEEMQKFLEIWAKTEGYKSLFCFSEKEVLVKRYMELGYMPTLKNVTTLVKEIG